MEKRVRSWLAASGSLPTIQARLRADLYAAIQVSLLLEEKISKEQTNVSGTGVRSHLASET